MTSTMLKVGDRIELVEMPDDPFPIPVGTRGTVTSVPKPGYPLRQIGIKWDISSSLFLIEGVDRYQVIEEACSSSGQDTPEAKGTGSNS